MEAFDVLGCDHKSQTHVQESSAGKLFENGLGTQLQLEQLQARQGEEEAVEGWCDSVQRERMMHNELTAAKNAGIIDSASK